MDAPSRSPTLDCGIGIPCRIRTCVSTLRGGVLSARRKGFVPSSGVTCFIPSTYLRSPCPHRNPVRFRPALAASVVRLAGAGIGPRPVAPACLRSPTRGSLAPLRSRVGCASRIRPGVSLSLRSSYRPFGRETLVSLGLPEAGPAEQPAGREAVPVRRRHLDLAGRAALHARTSAGSGCGQASIIGARIARRHVAPCRYEYARAVPACGAFWCVRSPTRWVNLFHFYPFWVNLFHCVYTHDTARCRLLRHAVEMLQCIVTTAAKRPCVYTQMRHGDRGRGAARSPIARARARAGQCARLVQLARRLRSNLRGACRAPYAR